VWHRCVVRACVRACVCVCVRVCVCVCVRACVCVRMCALAHGRLCVRAYIHICMRLYAFILLDLSLPLSPRHTPAIMPYMYAFGCVYTRVCTRMRLYCTGSVSVFLIFFIVLLFFVCMCFFPSNCLVRTRTHTHLDVYLSSTCLHPSSM